MSLMRPASAIALNGGSFLRQHQLRDGAGIPTKVLAPVLEQFFGSSSSSSAQRCGSVRSGDRAEVSLQPRLRYDRHTHSVALTRLLRIADEERVAIPDRD